MPRAVSWYVTCSGLDPFAAADEYYRALAFAMPPVVKKTSAKKPFAGENDSQIQFRNSSLSSLPSVKNTEENEGNEEQNAGNLACGSTAAAGYPLVSSVKGESKNPLPGTPIRGFERTMSKGSVLGIHNRCVAACRMVDGKGASREPERELQNSVASLIQL